MTEYINISNEREISFLKDLLSDQPKNNNGVRKTQDLNVVGILSTFKPFLEKYKRNQLIHTNIETCYSNLGKYKDIIFDLNKYEEYLLQNDISSIDLSTFFKYIYKLEDILESLQQGDNKDGTNNIDVQDIINKAEDRLLNTIFKYYLNMVKPFNPYIPIQNGEIFPSILDDQECIQNLHQIIEFCSNQDKLPDVLKCYVSERQNFIKSCLSYISLSKINKDDELKLAFDSISSFISIENFLIKDLKFSTYLEEEVDEEESNTFMSSYAIFQQIISFMCAKVLSKVKKESTNENSPLNKFIITNNLTNLTNSLVALDKEYNTKTVVVEEFVKQQNILDQTCQMELANFIANAKTRINQQLTKLPSDFGINSNAIDVFSKLKQRLDNNRADVIQFMAHNQIPLKSWLPKNEQGIDLKEFKNTDINLNSSKMKYQIYILDFITVIFSNLENKSNIILANGKRSDYPQYFNQNYKELSSESSTSNTQTVSQSIPKAEISTISGVFLLTHLKILQQLLSDQKTTNRESSALIELKLTKLDKKYSELILIHWKQLIQPMMPLINNSSMKTSDPNFKKHKELAKEKFLRFNDNFDKLLSNWTLNLKPLIKDKSLKKKLKKDIKLIIEPMYKLLYDKYSTNWFKNKAKYIRFDTRELSKKLDSL
ncbi:hypothetical protein ACO0SA_000217 [Hanseniaspora valbyensis]